jgi:alkylation response protein AidB-like acyl-CoA dehydrogenase
MPLELEPITAPGRAFVERAEALVPTLRERAAKADREGRFPHENVASLREAGLLGALVPEELGGLGVTSVHDWGVALARLGRGEGSTAIAINMHLGTSRALVQRWHAARASGDTAGAEAAAGPLRAIAAGQLVICATATEPGTDFLRPNTTATPVEGEEGTVRLDGRKIFVTLSPAAQLFAMNVRVPTEDGDRIAFAFVPASAPGLEPQDDWDALGMRSSGSQSFRLDGVRVPASSLQIAGAWGEWSPGLLMGRTLANQTLLGAFLGIAEHAAELARHAANTQTKPKAQGPIANLPGVQHRVGELEITLAGCRAALATAGRALDERLEQAGGQPLSLEEAHAAMADYQAAKWIVNQGAIEVVSMAMDVAGGGAFMSGNPLSRLYRDVRAGPFMQPYTPTEAREYVGQVALGRSPKG